MSAFRRSAWHAHGVHVDQPHFRVTFTAPNGFKYEMTGKATPEVEAERLADETLEYVERVGIRDHMRDDGTTVDPPAQLQVDRIQPDEATPGFGLWITAPNGTVTRK